MLLLDPPQLSTNAGSATDIEPRVRVVNSSPISELWPWHDRISWAATLLLVLLGYSMLFVVHRVLKRLQENTQLLEEVAHTATDCIEIARLTAKTLSEHQRPWITISVEPISENKNSFRIVATNRGLSPAELASTFDRVGVVRNESFLPKVPEYAVTEAAGPSVQIVIFPGCSAVLQTFGHNDLRWICPTQERLQSVLRGVDQVIIYGKVLYKSKVSDGSRPLYETDWCYRYLLQDSSGTLVPCGSNAYRQQQ